MKTIVAFSKINLEKSVGYTYKAILFLGFFIVITSFSTQKEWKLEKSKNGITVYSYVAEGESLKQIKSHTIIKTSMASLISTLNDVNGYKNWIYKCIISTKIKEINESKMIFYTVNDAPWPVLDRELYVHNNMFREEKTGIVYSISKPLPMDKMPLKKGKIRVNDFYGEWKFTPLKGGKIAVDYLLKLDPAGKLPNWLVNLTLEIGPYQTLLAFKDEVLKEKHQKAVFNYNYEPKN